MARLVIQKVLSVKHWDDKLFSFKTTRDNSLRFKNGECIKLGLAGETKPTLRNYSIASPNYEEDYLEFFSIKKSSGQLTSRLQHLQPGDDIYIGSQANGNLVVDQLKPGKNLYLIATGTGLAPFMSIIFDPKIYQDFEKIVLFHGVKHVSELAYRDLIENQIENNPHIGKIAKNKLIYYPSVTGESFKNRERISELIQSENFFKSTGMAKLNPKNDRLMLCGSPNMLSDMQRILDQLGFKQNKKEGELSDYLVEDAFVDS